MLGVNKVLAVYIGPAGFALLGQYQSLLQLLSMLSTNTINSGIVKHTAESEAEDDGSLPVEIWRVAIAYSLLASLLLFLLMFSFGSAIASLFLGSAEYSSVLIYFSISFFFMCANNIFLAIFNGKGLIVRLTLANSIGSLISFITVALLAEAYGLWGALVGFSIYQGIWFSATFFLARRLEWCRAKNFIGGFGSAAVKSLSAYFFMSLVTACCIPISHLLIRSYISTEYSLEQAGYWDALLRFSNSYLSLGTTVLAVYYLPKLARIKSKSDLLSEILSGYKLVLPIGVMAAVIIYQYRELVVTTVYTDAFLPMANIVLLQLGGDVLKIGSWFLSYYLVAKAKTRQFVFSEVGFTISYVVLTVLFTEYLGYEFVVLGYFVNFLIYWIFMAFLIFRSNGLADQDLAES